MLLGWTRLLILYMASGTGFGDFIEVENSWPKALEREIGRAKAKYQNLSNARKPDEQLELCYASSDEASGFACVLYGRRLAMGAIRVYGRACVLGNSFGCILLGYSERDPSDITQAKPIESWERACVLGNLYGCALAAQWKVQFHGEKVEEHEPRLLAGCEAKIANACAVVSNLYWLYGSSDQQAKAEVFRRKACALGRRDCCRLLESD